MTPAAALRGTEDGWDRRRALAVEEEQQQVDESELKVSGYRCLLSSFLRRKTGKDNDRRAMSLRRRQLKITTYWKRRPIKINSWHKSTNNTRKTSLFSFFSCFSVLLGFFTSKFRILLLFSSAFPFLFLFYFFFSVLSLTRSFSILFLSAKEKEQPEVHQNETRRKSIPVS